jgi:hypothetical protein
MMRKLAVTVFVLSLAAVGCGSDSGTPSKSDTSVQPDGAKAEVAVVPDAPANQDSADVAVGPETTPPVDTAQSEANTVLDGGKADTQVVDVTPTVDGGADSKGIDSGTTLDTGTPVDGGAVDTGSAG